MVVSLDLLALTIGCCPISAYHGIDVSYYQEENRFNQLKSM